MTIKNTYYTIVHVTGKIYLGRDGKTRDLPLLFSESSHASDVIVDVAQVITDWAVAVVHVEVVA